MHKRVRRRKIRKILFYTLILALFALFGGFFIKERHSFVDNRSIENIVVVRDGVELFIPSAHAKTVGDVLNGKHLDVSENDQVFPSQESAVYSGDIIYVERQKKVTVEADEKEQEIFTYRDELNNVLSRNDISLDENDILKPSKDTMVSDDLNVKIIRVKYEEEVKTKKIAYETINKKDDSINFLKKFTEQKGENGIKEIIYRIAYYDGEEVDREVINEETTKEPVDEIIVQGTKVKLGKKHTGLCSWYAYTGTLAAANPWLPKGSYVKVTNKANGKSVIVKINDRGPFVPGRIIDLDKVAFEEIASLGAGVIDVVMEEVIN